MRVRFRTPLKKVWDPGMTRLFSGGTPPTVRREEGSFNLKFRDTLQDYGLSEIVPRYKIYRSGHWGMSQMGRLISDKGHLEGLLLRHN
jgi:hypothetical protein